ncbi:MAG: hypothetical protein HQK91_07055 [Nitrospirae bacterium]|nr:hypothetical protein [Nitrospirota bacterium]
MLDTIFKKKVVTDTKKAMIPTVITNNKDFERAADKVLKKLEKKIEILEAIESSVDKKLAAFERLIHLAENIKTPGTTNSPRYEIVALNRRGLEAEEIAGILDIPRGEIELILNLNGAV